MSEHKHADFLRAIAEGEPLSDWEIHNRELLESRPVEPIDFEYIVQFPENYTLRRNKMVTRTISYPEPMREAPELQSTYWVASPDSDVYAYAVIWGDRHIDKLCLRRGICHATKEAAQAHGKALEGVSDE